MNYSRWGVELFPLNSSRGKELAPNTRAVFKMEMIGKPIPPLALPSFCRVIFEVQKWGFFGRRKKAFVAIGPRAVMKAVLKHNGYLIQKPQPRTMEEWKKVGSEICEEEWKEVRSEFCEEEWLFGRKVEFDDIALTDWVKIGFVEFDNGALMDWINGCIEDSMKNDMAEHFDGPVPPPQIAQCIFEGYKKKRADLFGEEGSEQWKNRGKEIAANNIEIKELIGRIQEGKRVNNLIRIHADAKLSLLDNKKQDRSIFHGINTNIRICKARIQDAKARIRKLELQAKGPS